MPCVASWRPSAIWRAFWTASVTSSTRKPAGRRSFSIGGAACTPTQDSAALSAIALGKMRSALQRSFIAAPWLGACHGFGPLGSDADLRAGRRDLAPGHRVDRNAFAQAPRAHRPLGLARREDALEPRLRRRRRRIRDEALHLARQV